MNRKVAFLLIIFGLLLLLSSSALIGDYFFQRYIYKHEVKDLVSSAIQIKEDCTDEGVLISSDGQEPDIVPGLRSLQIEYPDLCGFIEVPKTEIFYPVVCRKGDPDYYEKRSFSGERNVNGAIVSDEGSLNSDSVNIILYGNNMRNGTMFHDLRNFRA